MLRNEASLVAEVIPGLKELSPFVGANCIRPTRLTFKTWYKVLRVALRPFLRQSDSSVG